MTMRGMTATSGIESCGLLLEDREGGVGLGVATDMSIAMDEVAAQVTPRDEVAFADVDVQMKDEEGVGIGCPM